MPLTVPEIISLIEEKRDEAYEAYNHECIDVLSEILAKIQEGNPSARDLVELKGIPIVMHQVIIWDAPTKKFYSLQEGEE